MQPDAAVRCGFSEFLKIAFGGAVNGISAPDEDRIRHIAQAHIVSAREFFGNVFDK